MGGQLPLLPPVDPPLSDSLVKQAEQLIHFTEHGDILHFFTDISSHHSAQTLLCVKDNICSSLSVQWIYQHGAFVFCLQFLKSEGTVYSPSTSNLTLCPLGCGACGAI